MIDFNSALALDLSQYATQSWVTNKGYATQSWVTNKLNILGHIECQTGTLSGGKSYIDCPNNKTALAVYCNHNNGILYLTYKVGNTDITYSFGGSYIENMTTSPVLTYRITFYNSAKPIGNYILFYK